MLEQLELKDVTILGHSMGCSVLWCHHDLFGPQRIARYVFCDQALFLPTDPACTPQQVADYGPIFTPVTAALPGIKTPTLFIGGKSSLMPHTCVAWESTQVPGAKLSIFSESKLGSHFMFAENPAKFNAELAAFMG